MIRKILVPLDGTNFAEEALPVACLVARRTGAEVHLAQVHIPVLVEEMYTDAPDRECRAAERKHLERLAEEAAATGIKAVATVLDGSVVDTLVFYAEEVSIDLVIMATHGRGPVGRLFLGSVAAPLVRSLPVPTLLVHPAGSGTAAPGAPTARHILVALDGSPEAEKILPTATGLGEATGARFTLARVVPPAVTYGAVMEGMTVAYPDEDATRDRAAEAAEYLEGLARPMRDKGLAVATKVVTRDDPAGSLLDLARSLGCDLIAMESHGRSGLSRLVYGSVAEEVVRGGNVPVLTHVGHP